MYISYFVNFLLSFDFSLFYLSELPSDFIEFLLLFVLSLNLLNTLSLS
jgi:hypothetical protein